MQFLKKWKTILATLFIILCVNNNIIISFKVNNNNQRNNEELSAENFLSSIKEEDRYLQIILSRLFIYENRLYQYLVNAGLLTKTDDSVKDIPNTNILQVIQKEMSEKLDKSKLKTLKRHLDVGMSNFFTQLKKIGEFKVEGTTFSYKINS
jgi:hypothetical protein